MGGRKEFVVRIQAAAKIKGKESNKVHTIYIRTKILWKKKKKKKKKKVYVIKLFE